MRKQTCEWSLCSASDTEALATLERLADEKVAHWEAELAISSDDRDRNRLDTQAEG